MAQYNIRPAKPSDSAFCAHALLMAERGHLSAGLFDVLLPGASEGDIERLLRAAILDDGGCPSPYSLENFLVAETPNGTPVGTITGWSPYPKGAIYKTMVKAAQTLGSEYPHISEKEVEIGFEERTDSFGECAPDCPQDHWIVECVYTDPDHRRRGINQMLFKAVLERGRERRMEKAQICVLIGNDAAERSYVKAGMKFSYDKTSENFARDYGGSPGFRVLHMDIH